MVAASIDRALSCSPVPAAPARRRAPSLEKAEARTLAGDVVKAVRSEQGPEPALRVLGVVFESVNVAADPSGLAELRALGARSVPIVSRGTEYTLCQSMGDVVKFLGKRRIVRQLEATPPMRRKAMCRSCKVTITPLPSAARRARATTRGPWPTAACWPPWPK